MKQSKKISYSSIFLQFIDPLLEETEDENTFMVKAKLGQTAWNFCVSDQANLSINSQMKSILKAATRLNPQANQLLNQLVLRKQTEFAQYDQFIFHMEVRTKPDGERVLRVESAPVSAMKK
ncbi:MAG: hypothetical protein AAGA10_03680 [Bacteroidota bacterium]